MDTWLILYLMRKRGFAPPRRRPFRTFTLEDEITLLADVIRVYYPFVLEDELSISSGLAKASKRLQLDDEIRISDAVFNALRKISLEDEISISDSLYNALRKVALEDEISIADSLKNVYKPISLSDELVLTSACVKSLATGSAITLEDELNIYDSLQLAYDTVKTLTLEDSLHIGDSLKKSVTTIHLEDSLRIGDSLKLAKREIALEDDINISDSLKHAKRRIQLEDGLDVADSLKLSVNKQVMEDSLRIGDRLVIHRQHEVGCNEYIDTIVFDNFESGQLDTDTWCEMTCGEAYVKCYIGVVDKNAFSGKYSLEAVHNTDWQSSSRCYLFAKGIGANYENVSCSAWIYVPSTPAVGSPGYYDGFGFYVYDQSEKCGDLYGDHYLCKVSFVPDYYANSERICQIDINLLGVGDLNTGATYSVDVPTDAWYKYVVRADTYDDKTVITACVLDSNGDIIVSWQYEDTREERLTSGNVGFMFEFVEGGSARYLLVDNINVCKML